MITTQENISPISVELMPDSLGQAVVHAERPHQSLCRPPKDVLKSIEQRCGSLNFIRLPGAKTAAISLPRPSTRAQSLVFNPPLVPPIAWELCPPAGISAELM